MGDRNRNKLVESLFVHCTIRGGLLLYKVSVKPVAVPILNVYGARFSFGSAFQGLKVSALKNSQVANPNWNQNGCKPWRLLFGLISDANKYLKIDISLDFWVSTN